MRRPVVILLGLGLMAISSAQSPGPSIRYAVLESCIQQLRSDGIIIGYFNEEFGWHRSPSNYEYAVAAHASFVSLEAKSKDLKQLSLSPAFLKPGTAEAAAAVDVINARRGEVAIRNRDITITQMLFRTFAKELKDLGVDTKSASHVFAVTKSRFDRFANSRIPKVGENLEPFVDVPADHWASVATSNLRRNGIVSGYSDGKFRG